MSEQQPVIDVHAHLTPHCFQRGVRERGEWHGMGPEYGELDNPPNRWGTEQRLEEMDALGVDMQVVSPTDCFYQYDRDPQVTARIAAEANEEIAGMVRDHPTRFMGIGTLPMQDVGRAVAEMRRGIEDLGLTGFMIDDHVNGRTYDEDDFDDIWSAAEELGAFLLVHQYAGTVVALRTERYFLLNSIGNLADRTITYGAFVYGGVLDRHPDLKVCLAHAGGYVAFALDRLDKGWEMWPDSRGRSQDRPSAYVDRFFYDCVTFTRRNLRFLIDAVGIDRVVFGTDWPAPMQLPDPVRWIERVEGLAPGEREAILHRNAARMIGERAPAMTTTKEP
jgi:aminocarboxymuconate-semialdehyde decarboxylase